MAFDWVRFFTNRGIEYVETGPNVSRGNVNIRCPWCGASDESHHMGVSLAGKGYGCWRNHNHRGKSTEKLIVALTGCSYDEAKSIAGAGADVVLPGSDFAATVHGMLSPVKTSTKIRPIKWIDEARPLHKVDGGRGEMFMTYMTGRLYDEQQVRRLARRYDLRYALSGPFANRIMVPVYMPEGLVNWTGRAIGKSAAVRYRTLSADARKAADDNLPVAPVSIERTLLNYDMLLDDGGDVLIVAEGPFDALRLDFFGYRQRVRGTCLFGKSLSEEQVLLLERLAPNFKRRVLLLDTDARLDVLDRMTRLQPSGFVARMLPDAKKDPALLTEKELSDLFGWI